MCQLIAIYFFQSNNNAVHVSTYPNRITLIRPNLSYECAVLKARGGADERLCGGVDYVFIGFVLCNGMPKGNDLIVQHY